MKKLILLIAIAAGMCTANTKPTEPSERADYSGSSQLVLLRVATSSPIEYSRHMVPVYNQTTGQEFFYPASIAIAADIIMNVPREHRNAAFIAHGITLRISPE